MPFALNRLPEENIIGFFFFPLQKRIQERIAGHGTLVFGMKVMKETRKNCKWPSNGCARYL
jgi:hypothetical protein